MIPSTQTSLDESYMDAKLMKTHPLFHHFGLHQITSNYHMRALEAHAHCELQTSGTWWPDSTTDVTIRKIRHVTLLWSSLELSLSLSGQSCPERKN